MTTQQVADKIVKLCSEGKFQEAYELYSPDIVSMEAGAPPGQSRESKGLAAVKAKGEWWTANHEVHSATVKGPLVAGSHFPKLQNGCHLQATRPAVHHGRGGSLQSG
jgi:hypothetical protein